MSCMALPGRILLGAIALLLSACGSLVPSIPDRAPGDGPLSRGAVNSAPQSPAPRSDDAVCLAELGQTGARFAPLPDAYEAPGCARLGTVRLAALAGDRSSIALGNLGPVRCDLARTFGAWARFGVDRAARQILGSGLARVETMGSYSCRNVAGSGRRSAHASAAAIDISGFVLADGRRITLTEDWDGGTAQEREFLRAVHRSACRRFGTVLGPEYNRAHRDHFHVEQSGGGFCR